VTPWLSTALQIVIPVLAVVAAAVINLKIRFAPSREAATQELKDLALWVILWVIQWISGLVTIGSLVYNVFFMSNPLTRVVVFTIAYQVASMMFVVTLYFVNRIFDRIRKLDASIIETNETVERLTNSLRVVSDTVTLTERVAELRLEEHKHSLESDKLRSLLQDKDKASRQE
jgi:hypothetical protein